MSLRILVNHDPKVLRPMIKIWAVWGIVIVIPVKVMKMIWDILAIHLHVIVMKIAKMVFRQNHQVVNIMDRDTYVLQRISVS